jgi:hypothetical protein
VLELKQGQGETAEVPLEWTFRLDTPGKRLEREYDWE